MSQEDLREEKLEWKVLFNEIPTKKLFTSIQKEKNDGKSKAKQKIETEELPRGHEGSA